ncbi:unnamed protein product [Urochloa humidicola]
MKRHASNAVRPRTTAAPPLEATTTMPGRGAPRSCFTLEAGSEEIDGEDDLIAVDVEAEEMHRVNRERLQGTSLLSRSSKQQQQGMSSDGDMV